MDSGFFNSITSVIRVGTAIVLVAAVSSCTKAQLIGTKKLNSVRVFSVLAIYPSSGPKAGGTTLTVSGTGFKSGMTIKIGGITCNSVNVLNSVLATCVTGSSSVTGADVVAITNGDGSGDVSKTYTYLGSINATVTRIASGGNINSTGGAGVNKVTARTTIATGGHSGNVSSGGAGANKVTVLGGAIGVFSLH